MRTESQAAAQVRHMNRPCPKSKLHKATGQVFVEFRLGDERRRVYLGSGASSKWVGAYAKFAASWPAALLDTPPPRPRPAARLLTYGDTTRTLWAWARSMQLKPGTLSHRINVLKWPLAKALFTPARTRGACPRLQHDHANGRAFVRWRHRKKLLVKTLGSWASPEAAAAYREFCDRWKMGKL